MWHPGPHRRRVHPTAAATMAAVGAIVVLSVSACGSDLATAPGPDVALTASTVADTSTTATTGAPAAPTDDETLQVETDDADSSSSDEETNSASTETGPSTTTPPVTEQPTTGASAPPDWLGQRTLPTTADRVVVPQTTPTELVDRRLITVDTLPPPAGERFESTIGPVPPSVLARSTWQEGCPVEPSELSYLTLSFWGFDGRAHTGEMIVNAEVADDVVAVFADLHDARFPIEEMRVTALPELDAEPTGDGNNTASFVCRAVVGGSRFSQHAYGLAVDVNPFHNPYKKGELVLPELATSYLDRAERPGVIQPDGPVVRAFADIGWFWGGNWTSLDDYHHFSRDNR